MLCIETPQTSSVHDQLTTQLPQLPTANPAMNRYQWWWLQVGDRDGNQLLSAEEHHDYISTLVLSCVFIYLLWTWVVHLSGIHTHWHTTPPCSSIITSQYSTERYPSQQKKKAETHVPSWLTCRENEHSSNIHAPYCTRHTLSLCSLLFTIRAVICWSMKTKIVASKAGMAAAGIDHTGFLPSGGITQPLSSAFVGWNFKGISSFGVLTPNAMSTPTIIMILIRMAKSETTARTC